MPIHFGLLSMTELRTRPGEILDRVADAGEAFIIERNGQRKACLVPLSVLLPDISPARIADEIQELVANDEEPSTTFTGDRELAFRFPHQLADGKSVELAIVLPHGYPNNCPRVYVNAITESVPHRWVDGALCLYGVMSAWNPGKHTVCSTLKLARRWLHNYDTWRSVGQWPAHEELSNE
jgi:antitoxin (DNA-binding transcriptional repressor) of toxin-antitoxin stability system